MKKGTPNAIKAFSLSLLFFLCHKNPLNSKNYSPYAKYCEHYVTKIDFFRIE